MRTVVFFGLMTISSAIGAQTGYAMDELTVGFAAVIFLISAFMDIIEFVKGVDK